MSDRYKVNRRWRPEIDERWDQVFPMEVDFSEATLSDLTISKLLYDNAKPTEMFRNAVLHGYKPSTNQVQTNIEKL